MTHPGYPPPDDPQHMPPPQQPYPAAGYPPPQMPPPMPPPQQMPPPQVPTSGWPATASAPPYAVSGAPAVTSVPYGQPQPPSQRSSTTTVLIITAVALFLLGGVMTGLFLVKNNELGDTKQELTSQVSERDKTITSNQEKLTKLEADLKAVTDELAKNKTSLADVTKDRDALVPCMRRFNEALDAAGRNNEAALDTALRQATTACEKAKATVDS
ncbi:hypothetical protein [Phytohabitans aurantiacus]|jgi:hypothetical protein|uniref:Uncharacterized protein n=1 Tax=Phytohabitans aurantiacus TaxID=3016789 RepID=A0ABQ5QTF1_9ACTN|nr:hypothetical protein [Phytohabitans aurantiacus]GLH97282.1 hypothetical protein Pa4123_25570 [Phytohabitans aurantiacus]